MNVEELLQEPEGYVNGDVTAACLHIEPKKAKATGKAFWVAKMASQSGASVELALFTAPKFKVGDVVNFSGQGIKFAQSNFGPKLSVSEKTVGPPRTDASAQREPTRSAHRVEWPGVHPRGHRWLFRESGSGPSYGGFAVFGAHQVAEQSPVLDGRAGSRQRRDPREPSP